MKLTLIRFCAVAALGGALAMPALAQVTPEQTNLDPAAAQMEMRNARGNQLTDVTPEQARANALRRCDNLPDFYRQDCIKRVESDHPTLDSVIGGGDFKETVTTMPKSELERERANIGPIQLPPRSN
ncbi:MAG: hypothetical protein WCZ18_00665 [Ottowia sp.]